jgi:hypothetical protein
MKNKQMKKLSLVLLLSLMVFNAEAAVTCKAYPSSEWSKQQDLEQALTDEGYTIKELKIDHHCYEMYGKNKQGKKVEIYFDMKSLAIIAAEVEK